MKSSSGSRCAPAARAVFFVVFAVSAVSMVAQTKPPAPAATPQASAAVSAAAPTAPANLQEARARLAKAETPAAYAAMLDAFAASLPPSDALSLLEQSLSSTDPKALAGPEQRSSFLIKAGDLALLLGLFDEAAASYAEAATQAPEAARAGISAASAALLVRAARCDLAAGDTEKALDISSKLMLGTEDPDTASASRLVGAWALALQGRQAEAAALAISLTQSTFTPERRREARFILWYCASGDAKDKAAATLAAEFPGSPEALIASGSAATPPLPHWYLGGLPTTAVPAPPTSAAPQTAAPASAAPQTAPATQTAATQSASTPVVGTRGKRLQIGYFSVEENARALRDELASKGFAAEIEQQMHDSGSGKAPEQRWIVTVRGAKDLATTMQALKDAGYEAYIID